LQKTTPRARNYKGIGKSQS